VRGTVLGACQLRENAVSLGPGGQAPQAVLEVATSKLHLRVR
jgi:hypothetical protein